jgi:digeranylgeranylglycerophospholipid reductase
MLSLMTRNTEHDIIIVGAGPIGSYTAFLLANEGFNVGLFEKNPSIGKDVNCSGIVSVECFKRFGLPSASIIRNIDAIKVFSPSGNCMQYRSEAPLVHVIDRSLFDRELNMNAATKGVTTYLNSRVKEIDNTKDAFRIKIKTVDEEREFSSKIGIIATGFELNAVHGMPGRSKEFLYGIQTEATMEDINEVEVYLGEEIAPGSFSWIIPADGASVRIGLMTEKEPLDFLKKFLRNPLVSARMKACEGSIKCSPIPISSVPRSYAERLIIVGEAAGQVKATTGGGIYFGLLCSEIAAQTVTKAFRNGNFSEELFRGYETEWKSRLEPELKAGMLLRSIFSRLSDRQIDILVDLAKKDGFLPVIKKYGFDWHKDIISYLISHLLPGNIFKR